MHGNEPVGRQLILYLAEYLLKNYGKDNRVTEIVDTTEIYLMPSMNPDGFEKSPEGFCGGSYGRKNGNGQDLNRDFPRRWKYSAGSDKVKEMEKGRQPETIAMMRWILNEPFVLVLSIVTVMEFLGGAVEIQLIFAFE